MGGILITDPRMIDAVRIAALHDIATVGALLRDEVQAEEVDLEVLDGLVARARGEVDLLGEIADAQADAGAVTQDDNDGGDSTTNVASHKTCKVCGEEKPLDQYHRNAIAADGRIGVCIDCRREQGREAALRKQPPEPADDTSSDGEEPATKVCTTCGQTKPADADHFITRNGQPTARCRDCASEAMAKARAARKSSGSDPAASDEDPKPEPAPARQASVPRNNDAALHDPALASVTGPRVRIVATCPEHGVVDDHSDPAPEDPDTWRKTAGWVAQMLHHPCKERLTVTLTPVETDDDRNRPQLHRTAVTT